MTMMAVALAGCDFGKKPEPPPGANLTDEQAWAIMKNIPFTEGCSPKDPRALAKVKEYGTRIELFGGHSKPTDPTDETWLFKPVGQKTKKLVILTPSSVYLDSVTVGNETKTTCSVGNGFRPTWRFSKAGAAYGPNIVVKFKPYGEVTIKNPALRQNPVVIPYKK